MSKRGEACDFWDLSCLAAEAVNRTAGAVCRRRLRVALVGAGIFAQKAHLPSLLKDSSDCFELAAIWSRSVSSAEAAGEVAQRLLPGASRPELLSGEAGWQELLSGRLGLDLLDLVLPIPEQPRFVEAALRNGLAVVSEKPLAPDLETGRKLLRAAAGASGRWFVAENWRFEPPFRIAAAAHSQGAIGEVVAFSCSSMGFLPGDSAYLKSGSWRTQEDADWIVDVGVHIAAGLRTALGEDVLVTHSTSKRLRQAIEPFDTFAAMLTSTERGVPGTWLFSLSSARPEASEVPGLSDAVVQVIGTNGSVVATRGTAELRDKDGKTVAKVGGLASYSVASALREVALELQGARPQGLPLYTAAEEAFKDLEVMCRIAELGQDGLQATVLQRKAEL